jgi:hypothetical protein
MNVQTSITNKLSYGFTQKTGQQNKTSLQDQIRAEIKVPPLSSINATVIGHRMEVDIPYSATLVTTYSDGSTSERPVSGVYNNVETGRFRIQYGAARPLDKTR